MENIDETVDGPASSGQAADTKNDIKNNNSADAQASKTDEQWLAGGGAAVMR